MAEIEVWDEKGRRTLTDEQYVAEFGEERWRMLATPTVPYEELTKGGRYLADKMRSEAEVNAALAEAGYESIFDLPVEGDDEVLLAGDLSDFVPREHDHERALELHGRPEDGENAAGDGGRKA